MGFAKKEADKPRQKRTYEQLLGDFTKEDGDRPTLIYEDSKDRRARIPTRFLRLNQHLSGGIPEGSIFELYGPEDSSKSSTAIALAADIQKWAREQGRPGVVAMLNFEGPEAWKWWGTLGLDTTPKGFIQIRPTSLEQGVGRGALLVESGQVCALIIDSVYAAEAKGSREAVFGKWASSKGKGAGMGLEARTWGTAWTSLKGVLQDSGCVALAVNQIREVINAGGPPRPGFMGPPTTTPRGKALKFYAWVRLEFSASNLDQEKHPGKDGRSVKIKLVKNKVSDHARARIAYDLIRGEGYDLARELKELALEYSVVQHNGGGSYVLGNKKCRGDAQLTKLLSDPKILKVVRAQVEQKLSEAPPPVEEEVLERPGANEDEEGDLDEGLSE